jgi:hypothetical protein
MKFSARDWQPVQIDIRFLSMMVADAGFQSCSHRRGACFGALAADSDPLCSGNPVQRYKTANVVDQVLQANLGARPHDADRAHHPATR